MLVARVAAYLPNELALFGLLLGIFMGSNAVLAEAAKSQITSLSTWIGCSDFFALMHPLLS